MCPLPHAVDECHQVTLHAQSVSVPTITLDPTGLQVNDTAMSTSEGELPGLLAHKILIPLRRFCNWCWGHTG
jgi:hypothetical protein